MKFFNSCIVALCLFAAVPTQAAPIDFGDVAWAPADNQASYTVGTVTAAANPLSAKLDQGAVYGLGVTFTRFDRESDEVNNLESLWLEFGSSMMINNFTVSKLFAGESSLFGTFNEKGFYSLDGVGWTEFTASSATGMLTVNVGMESTKLGFRAGLLSLRDDFAVKAVDVSDVPEPGAVTLMGLALSGVVMATRRRRKS